MKKQRFFFKSLLMLLVAALIATSLCGCEALIAKVKKVKGDLVGIAFTYYEYDSYGNRNFTVTGNKIGMEGVRTKSVGYDSDGDLVTTYELSSVVNITVDGYQHVACGSSLIFEEKGLSQVNVDIPEYLGSNKTGFSTITSVASWLNSIKNQIGKSKVIIIKSELGYPLAIYQGDSVYWEVADDLPKTTRISIDGKALYIHRVEFDIVDTDLL